MSTGDARYKLSRPVVGMAIALIALVGAGAWFAGVQYGRLQNQQIVSTLTDTQQDTTRLRVQLQQKQSQVETLDHSLRSSGSDEMASRMDAMRRQILRLQAEVSGFQAIADRDQKALLENERLASLLANPGAKLIALKNLEAGTEGVVYALVIENNRIILIASGLPPASQGREYRVWLNRKEEPRIVRVGLFAPDASKQAMIDFPGGDSISEITSLVVTEEPAGAGDTPTGKKVFASSGDE